MGFGFLSWALGYALGKGADRLLKGREGLIARLDGVIKQWSDDLPEGAYVNHEVFFSGIHDEKQCESYPKLKHLVERLKRRDPPEESDWLDAFMEQWQYIKENLEEPYEFFRLTDEEARGHFKILVPEVYQVCISNTEIFKVDSHKRIKRIDEGVSRIEEQLQKATPDTKRETLWPGERVMGNGPKVIDPFAGRCEELGQLEAAATGEHSIIAVIGRTGQGKSALAGQWYKTGKKRAEGVGLFWAKVYEEGYTFDRFVGELYEYLRGMKLDRTEYPEGQVRLRLTLEALGERPSWIVLDGVERWLNLWGKDKEAEAEDAVRKEDREGVDPLFDAFCHQAVSWRSGSRLILTTRALPEALEEAPVVRIGSAAAGQRERKLEDLKLAEAVWLLEQFCPETEKKVLAAAAQAYGCDPYAVNLLGRLLRKQHGGDGTHWEKVNPLEGTKLEGLLAAAVEVHGEDRGILELTAVSLGPAPVAMLATLTGREEEALREQLGELGAWQMAEFGGGETVDQHAVVRRYLRGQLGKEERHDQLVQIANWWSEREVAAQPQEIEEIRPLLWAVEHLLEAEEVDKAASIYMRKQTEKSFYSPEEWLRIFGYLEENIRLNTRVIEVYEKLVEQEGSRELRNDLAGSYNNRGLTRTDQGDLEGALEDYGKAIAITKQLVEQEDRRGLRNDLASCYNNRGVALMVQGDLAGAIGDFDKTIAILNQLVKEEDRQELRNELARAYNNRGIVLLNQGDLAGAIEDYAKAIAIYKELVEKEGRRELRNELAKTYNNRGIVLLNQGDLAGTIEDCDKVIEICEKLVEDEGRRELRNDLARALLNRARAYGKKGEWEAARGDAERGIELWRELIGEGWGQLLADYVKGLGWVGGNIEQLGIEKETAGWVNEGLGWLAQAAKSGKVTEVLEKEARGFLEEVNEKREALIHVGVDVGLLEAAERKLKVKS